MAVIDPKLSCSSKISLKMSKPFSFFSHSNWFCFLNGSIYKHWKIFLLSQKSDVIGLTRFELTSQYFTFGQDNIIRLYYLFALANLQAL